MGSFHSFREMKGDFTTFQQAKLLPFMTFSPNCRNWTRKGAPLSTFWWMMRSPNQEGKR